MNRLRDESALDPVSEHGIRLLQQVQPPPRPPEMKWRVWSALQQAPAGAPRGWRRGKLQAFVLGVGLLAFAATATAVGAIGGRWIVRRVERLRAPEAPVPTSIHERPRVVRRVAAALPAPEIQPLPTPAAPVELPPAAARQPEPARETPRPHHLLPSSPARERTQVLDALIALRRDHDPARASALLDHYFETNRGGPLREEALVLAIEAADGRHDPARAARFARTYQHEYPHGRFDAFVQSHLKD